VAREQSRSCLDTAVSYELTELPKEGWGMRMKSIQPAAYSSGWLAYELLEPGEFEQATETQRWSVSGLNLAYTMVHS
jgi:hypothetical protein